MTTRHKRNSANNTGKGKALLLQAWTGLEGSRKLRLPDFETIGKKRVVRMLALHTGRLYPQGDTPSTHFC
jgi:hypothetical protein